MQPVNPPLKELLEFYTPEESLELLFKLEQLAIKAEYHHDELRRIMLFTHLVRRSITHFHFNQQSPEDEQ